MVRDDGKQHGMPGMKPEERQVHDALVAEGVTSAASARDVGWIAKRLKHSKHDTEHILHILEGKGVVRHVTTGHETLWHASR